MCMEETYGYKLNVKQLCETRWNSMHGCFASLLRIRSALELLEVKFRVSADFPATLRGFADENFWNSLEEVVCPLSYASLKLQRDENTMADVVVCYLDIFAGFHKHPQAAKRLLGKTPLTSAGSLCGVGSTTSSGLELVRTRRGCVKIYTTGSSMTTSHRFHSPTSVKFTSIGTRNRMSPEKARKLALVRKQVREFDAEVGPSKGANTTRLIDPTERTRLRDRDDVFECNETEDGIEEECVVGPDTAFEYWQSVLCELEGDDDAPVSLGNAPDNTSSPQSAAAAAAAEERRFGAVLEKN
ncbi:hypothetical protein PPTG_01125 [Phytophthora nicotianae INRA-310]|uniref:Uncharacterized protein n=1 Tax=Phytophthora nicotianae (strain INRA-310) TaxID=761204 RepID=W2RK06_PHYN3|nr:hypothetical protein PPTG_01125 [Phytophthora nicotianae INRA-310]ETN24964.1 hypothetical protein PPTG_01125 [Phytophthora nicotianae INRA-310]